MLSGQPQPQIILRQQHLAHFRENLRLAISADAGRSWRPWPVNGGEALRRWVEDESTDLVDGDLLQAAEARLARGRRRSRLIGAGVLKVVAFIFVSPLMGFVLGSLMMVLVAWICRRTSPRKVDRWFRRLQLVSAGAYSLGNGGNDAQKTIGIIWLLLIATGYAAPGDDSPPLWAIVSCYTAIGLGTMFGGWRIVKTMGQKITKLKPVGGFCAETGGAITLFMATLMGIPVSTTHTITGAIVGVGSCLLYTSPSPRDRTRSRMPSSA